MFSVIQKREIAEKVQEALRITNHPELPAGEIQFELRVQGEQAWSWAVIQNNGAVAVPDVNPWNEQFSPSPKDAPQLDFMKTISDLTAQLAQVTAEREAIRQAANELWNKVVSALAPRAVENVDQAGLTRDPASCAHLWTAHTHGSL